VLIKLYCSDLYGSVLWDLSHSCIEDVCIAWRKGLKRALRGSAMAYTLDFIAFYHRLITT